MSGNNDSGRPESSYTAASVSEFLGGGEAWPTSKVEAILATLAAVEIALVEEGDLEGLSTYQAEQVARQTRRVAKETGDEKLAKNIGKRLASGMRSGTGQRPGVGGRKKEQQQAITYHGARRAADEMMGSRRRATTPKKMPDIETFAEQIVKDLASVPTDKMCEKLQALVQFRADLHPKTRSRLTSSLRSLAKRAGSWAEKMEG